MCFTQEPLKLLLASVGAQIQFHNTEVRGNLWQCIHALTF